MKMCHVSCLVTLLLTIATTATVSAADAQAGKLMKERVEAKKAVDAIRLEELKATGSPSQEYGALIQQMFTLEQPPMTNEQIAELQKNVQSMQKRLEAMQKQIELGSVKDPAERKAKLADIKTKAEAANAKLQEAREPFVKRTAEAVEPTSGSNADFAALLDGCFKDGSEKFAGAARQKVQWMNEHFVGQIRWLEGEPVIFAEIYLRDKPFIAPTDAEGRKLIDNKYEYLNDNSKQIFVRAGYFNISVQVNKKEWQGDSAALVALVKNLVDLNALAALKPE